MVEGGTAHGWERSTDQLVCLEVPPAPVYKGARGEAGRPSMGAPGGGVLLLVGVGLPFPTPTSVRTLRVRELCRHDRDMSPVNNQ